MLYKKYMWMPWSVAHSLLTTAYNITHIEMCSIHLLIGSICIF